MADRKNFFYLQKVTEAEVDSAFTQVENSLWKNRSDDALVGVISGLVPTLGAAPTLDVTSGVAITSLGKRIPAYIDSDLTKNHSFTTDTLGVATAVTTSNERWISIFASFGRQALDSRVDGNGDTVYHNQPECLHSGIVGVLSTAGLGGAGVDRFHIVSGVMAGTGLATRPALIAGEVLICDVLRTPSDASNVLSTSRRQVYGIPDATATGTGNGLAVVMSAMTTWLGGRTNPAAASLHAAIDKIIVDLAVTSATDDGAERIGATAAGTLSTGSVRSQLDQLDTQKPNLAGSNTFTGGGATQAVAGAITVGTTLGVTGVTTLSNRVRVTPGATTTPAFDAAQVPSSTRQLLFKFTFATGPNLRVYVSDRSITGGSSGCLLIASGVEWDGSTNWVTETGFPTLIEIGGSRSATDVYVGGSFRLYRSTGGTFADSGWTGAAGQSLDFSTVFSPQVAGVSPVSAVLASLPFGSNYLNPLNGEFRIGAAGTPAGTNGVPQRIYFGCRGNAAGAETDGGVINFTASYTGTPSSAVVTTEVNTNCAAASVSVVNNRVATWTTAVTGAGAWVYRGFIDVYL